MDHISPLKPQGSIIYRTSIGRAFIPFYYRLCVTTVCFSQTAMQEKLVRSMMLACFGDLTCTVKWHLVLQYFHRGAIWLEIRHIRWWQHCWHRIRMTVGWLLRRISSIANCQQHGAASREHLRCSSAVSDVWSTWTWHVPHWYHSASLHAAFCTTCVCAVVTWLNWRRGQMTMLFNPLLMVEFIAPLLSAATARLQQSVTPFVVNCLAVSTNG